MAPKQAGRHVSTQLEREAQGLKWKSASTIDRQRAQKKKQAKETPEKADGGDRGLAKPADAPDGPSSGGQWQGSA